MIHEHFHYLSSFIHGIPFVCCHSCFTEIAVTAGYIQELSETDAFTLLNVNQMDAYSI